MYLCFSTLPVNLIVQIKTVYITIAFIFVYQHIQVVSKEIANIATTYRFRGSNKHGSNLYKQKSEKDPSGGRTTKRWQLPIPRSRIFMRLTYFLHDVSHFYHAFSVGIGFFYSVRDIFSSYSPIYIHFKFPRDLKKKKTRKRVAYFSNYSY